MLRTILIRKELAMIILTAGGDALVRLLRVDSRPVVPPPPKEPQPKR